MADADFDNLSCCSTDSLTNFNNVIESQFADVSSFWKMVDSPVMLCGEGDQCIDSCSLIDPDNFFNKDPTLPVTDNDSTTTSSNKSSSDFKRRQQQQRRGSASSYTSSSSGSYDQGSSNISTGNMLSPPCSSEGDIDVDIVDYERLFPELAGFDVVEKLESCDTDKNAVSLENDNAMLSGSQNPINRNVVKVNISRVVPKKEALHISTHSNNDENIRASMSISDNFQHDYASTKGTNNTGRVPKYAEFEPETGFAICGPLSRNAILARENRRKKKEYINTLEGEIQTLTEQKSMVMNDLEQANATIDHLKEEVDYLKSVIANQTTLGALLKNIPMAGDIRLKRKVSSDSTGIKPAKLNKSDHDYYSSTTTTAAHDQPGVCLHVTEGICTKAIVTGQFP